MVNNLDNKTFLFVSKKKFIIVVYNNENKILYKNETIKESKTNILIYEFLNEFLKLNVFEIEKKIGEFIKNIFLIIDLDDVYSVELSIKNKLDNIILDNHSINNLLVEAKNSCEKTLENLDIIHMIIDRFYLNNKSYEVLPDQQICKTLSIDLNYICISKNIYKDLQKILSQYQISIEKILCNRYLSNFLDEQNINLFLTAQKIMSGFNENEVFLTSKSPKNIGFFEKFFNFFN
tara:strand:- start:527 stop:1228 length:702 start_codon:yes stop_codon:yes gene_type:complete